MQTTFLQWKACIVEAVANLVNYFWPMREKVKRNDSELHNIANHTEVEEKRMCI